MASPSETLAELGIALPSVVPPVAAYVPAVRTGSLVYTSGQLPMVDGQLVLRGKVGAEVGERDAYDCARICALNALAAGNIPAAKRHLGRWYCREHRPAAADPVA